MSNMATNNQHAAWSNAPQRPTVDTGTLPGAAEFKQSLLEYTGLNDTIAELEKLKKQAAEKLEFYLKAWVIELPDMAAPESGFDTDLGRDRGVYRAGLQQRAGNKTIKAELLLKQGVGMETITAATVQAPPSKLFVTVRRVKGEQGDGVAEDSDGSQV